MTQINIDFRLAAIWVRKQQVSFVRQSSSSIPNQLLCRLTTKSVINFSNDAFIYSKIKTLSDKYFFIQSNVDGKELERTIGEINTDKKNSQTIRMSVSKMIVLVVYKKRHHTLLKGNSFLTIFISHKKRFTRNWLMMLTLLSSKKSSPNKVITFNLNH